MGAARTRLLALLSTAKPNAAPRASPRQSVGPRLINTASNHNVTAAIAAVAASLETRLAIKRTWAMRATRSAAARGMRAE